MRRIIAVGIVTAVVTAACGGSAEPTTTEPPTTTAPVADETMTTTQPATTTTTTTTTAATTTVAGPAEDDIVPGEDPDADQIVALYAVVFDGTTTFDEKAPLITEPDGLEATVDAYAVASAAVGGIALEVRSVVIGADAADVSYDLLFAGNAFQTDQAGVAEQVDDSWKVSREYFCSIMQLARVACA